MEKSVDAFIDYYHTLGVTPDATPEEIKKAYRARMKFSHPDRHRGDAESQAIAGAEAQEINEAYSILSDPLRREEYTQRWLLFQGSPLAYQRLFELDQELAQATENIERLQVELRRQRREMRRRDEQLQVAKVAADQYEAEAVRCAPRSKRWRLRLMHYRPNWNVESWPKRNKLSRENNWRSKKRKSGHCKPNWNVESWPKRNKLSQKND